MNPFRNILAVTAVALFSASGTISAQSVILNGGFESDTFQPGWNVVDASNNSNVGPLNNSLFAGAREGANWANLGADPNIGFLSQTFSTTPGVQYTFSFSLATDQTGTAAPSNFFQALFNGVALLTLTNNAETDFNVNRGYVDYVFSNANTVASGTEGTIEFHYQHGDDFFRLDAVSVVPEPSTVSLLAMSAVGGLVFAYRRMRRSAKSTQV